MKYLTTSEARARWGAAVFRVHAGGVYTYADVVDAEGTWTPVYNPSMELVGYRCEKV